MKKKQVFASFSNNLSLLKQNILPTFQQKQEVGKSSEEADDLFDVVFPGRAFIDKVESLLEYYNAQQKVKMTKGISEDVEPESENPMSVQPQVDYFKAAEPRIDEEVQKLNQQFAQEKEFDMECFLSDLDENQSSESDFAAQRALMPEAPNQEMPRPMKKLPVDAEPQPKLQTQPLAVPKIMDSPGKPVQNTLQPKEECAIPQAKLGLEYPELSEESDINPAQKPALLPTTMAKPVEPQPQTQTQAQLSKTDQEYLYYLPQLLEKIQDFEASLDSEDDVVRRRRKDLNSGRIFGKNQWEKEEEALLKTYVTYLKQNSLRIHFGPIAAVLKKPRKDVQQKYEEIFLNVWSSEQRKTLFNLVRDEMKAEAYVDFEKIAFQLGKTAESCIHTYCDVAEMRWTPEMDAKLREFCFSAQEKPPFWSLIAFELGLYEMACIKRYNVLDLDKETAWTEEEQHALTQWWSAWRAEKFQTRLVMKQELRQLLPRKQIWEIRKRLTESGCRLDRIHWK